MKTLIIRSLRRLTLLLGVRGHEWGLLLVMVLHIFSVLCNQSLLRSLNTGLFLGAFDASWYPWYFLAESLLTLTLSLIYSSWVVGRVDRRLETLGFAVFFGLILLSGRLLLFQQLRWVHFVLPMFCDSLVGIFLIQTWGLYGDCLDSRKAKRLYPLIGFGGTLGAIAGGWGSSLLVSQLGTENLLFVALGLLGLALFLGLRIQQNYLQSALPGTQSQSPIVPASWSQKFREFSGEILGNKLLLLVILTLIGVRVASTIADFHLQVQLRGIFSQNEITGYMGSYLAITNLSMLVIQALLENRLLNAFGVVFGMTATPVALATGLSFFWLSPSLFSITVTKFLEQITRNSIFKTSIELVYLPFDSARRRKLRLRVNALLGLATVPCVSFAIMLLNGQQLPLTLLGLAFALAGAMVALELKKPYTQSLHESLMRRRLLLDGEGDAGPLELSSAQIEESLAHPDPEMVLFSLELLKSQALSVPVSQLLSLAEHENPYVREAAMHIMRRQGKPEWVDTVLYILRRERVARVREACFRVLQEIGDESLNTIAIEYLQDPNLSVQAQASVFLFTRGGIEGVLAGAEHIKRLMSSSDEAELEAAAQMMGAIGIRYFRKDFARMLASEAIALRKACLVAAGLTPEPGLMPLLFSSLQDRETAREALQSLRHYPPELVLPQAVKEFRRRTSSPAYRSELLRLISAFETAQSATSLLDLMQEPHLQLKYQALKACANLRRKHGFDLSDYHHVIYYQIQREFRYGYAFFFLVSLLHSNPVNRERVALLEAELNERIAFVQNMLFKLFTLLYHPGEMYNAYLNFRSQAPFYRALSLEALNYTLGRDLVDPALNLLDDVPMEKRLALARERGYIDDYIGEAWWNSSLIQEDRWLNRTAAWVRGLEPANEEEKAVFNVMDKVFLLKKTPLFQHFRADELTPVAQTAEEERVPAQTRVFRQGAPGDAFYVISQGEVMVERNGRDVTRLGQGECFGEVEILSASPRLATIRTLVPCELLRISREDFMDVIETYPRFARSLLEILSRRLGDNLIQMENWLPGPGAGKSD